MMAAAEELLAGMLEHGPSPDIISYNTLISGHALEQTKPMLQITDKQAQSCPDSQGLNPETRQCV